MIAQDVLMAQLRQKLNDADAFWTDDWDGYPANRARLLKRIRDSQVSNPVVVGGDIHAFFANDLQLDFDDPASPMVATEFVGTSISSCGAPYELFAQALPDNPHVHFSRAGGAAMSASISNAPRCSADTRRFLPPRSQC